MTEIKNANVLPPPEATIESSYGYGWRQMWKYFLHLFLVSIIYMAVESPMAIVHIQQDVDQIGIGTAFLILFGIAYALLFMPVISYGADYMFLRVMRNQEFDINQMFKGFNNYLNIILANLLVTAIVGFGFMLLIVPGVIFLCRLIFVPYLVMDRDMDPVKAVERSWEMTRGHGWKIFFMGIVAFFIIIAGLLLLIVGVFFAAIWVGAAFAALYHALELQEAPAIPSENRES
jgi:uncharacterized membrane protein